MEQAKTRKISAHAVNLAASNGETARDASIRAKRFDVLQVVFKIFTIFMSNLRIFYQLRFPLAPVAAFRIVRRVETFAPYVFLSEESESAIRIAFGCREV